MRIGFSFLGYNPDYVGGVNTYMHGLLGGLLNAQNPHKIQVYIFEKHVSALDRYKGNDKLEIVTLSGKNNLLLKAIRRLFALSQQEKLYSLSSTSKEIRNKINQKSDIFYIPTTLLYPTKLSVPTVVSIHDIQQFHYPEFFTLHDRLYRKTSYKVTIKEANYIQASSQFIQRDLLMHYPKDITKERIPVIPEGVNIKEFQESNGNIGTLKKYNLPNQFLFFPAQLWKHKNHIRVLEALKILRDESRTIIPLVLTGANYSGSQPIFNYIYQHQMNDQVYYLGKVPFKELLDLYKFSTYVITAVLYESSSLPMLEGAASGTPLIASRTPPNLEMSQKIKMTLFDPLNSRDIAEKILNCWENQEVGKEEAQDNLRDIYQYSWDNIAQKYIHFFESIFMDEAI